VPNALGQIMEQPQSVTCAVLCYGFMLDLDGATGVSKARGTWHFANPSEGKTVDDLPLETPLFIARGGRDSIPGINDSIDRFLAHALQRNLPVTFVNHPRGAHAFDLETDSDATRIIVREILAFLRSHLLPRDRGGEFGAGARR
jgi:hypothetical protein